VTIGNYSILEAKLEQTIQHHDKAVGHDLPRFRIQLAIQARVVPGDNVGNAFYVNGNKGLHDRYDLIPLLKS
jgi:hypothetical protein